MLLIAIPLWLNYSYRLQIGRMLGRGMANSIIMIAILGGILLGVSRADSIVLNIVVALLMVGVYSLLVVIKSRQKVKTMLLPVFLGMLSGAFFTSLWMLLFVGAFTNPFLTRFFIPVIGMLLCMMAGACARAMRTYSNYINHHGEIYEYLMGCGATVSEAHGYFMRRALQQASLPSLRAMGMLSVIVTPVLMWTMFMMGGDILQAAMAEMLLLVGAFSATMLSVVVSIAVIKMRNEK